MNQAYSKAIKLIFCIIVPTVLFHMCILLKIIPYDITWGGKLKNDMDMYVFESVSILLNLFFLWVVSMKGDMVSYKFSGRTLNIILWGYLILFSINTIGNLFAETLFEKLFLFITLLLAIAIWKILKKK